MNKTNVMRLMDAAQIEYKAHEYDVSITDGGAVAKILKEDPDQVFKTLVTVSNIKENFVFVIPVNRSLSLKKAAKAAGVKKIEMIKQKELFPLTSYVHGGCSPIGMKKEFPTFIEETAQLFDTIIFSGGRKGSQVEVNPRILVKFLSEGHFADVAE
ncbi:MAG: Cys-tRNA(Pro) deacylase [Bacteroidales bacterium]